MRFFFSPAPCLALILLTAAACDRVPTAAKRASGEYRLSAINGAALPVAFLSARGDSVSVIEGSLHLQPDGRYLQVLHYSAASGASAVSDAGAYRVAGAELEFRSSDYPGYAGRFAGEQLIVSVDLADADPGAELLTFVRQ